MAKGLRHGQIIWNLLTDLHLKRSSQFGKASKLLAGIKKMFIVVALCRHEKWGFAALLEMGKDVPLG